MEYWVGSILTVIGIAVGLMGMRRTGWASVLLTALAACILFYAAFFVAVWPDYFP